MIPKHIVAALDLSAYSKHVIRVAQEYAGALGARLTLVHTLELAPSPPGIEGLALTGLPPNWEQVYTDTRRDAALRRMEDLRAEASAAAPGLPLSVEILHGLLPDTLMDYLSTAQADLLIVGTHGRTGVARLFLGSVAEKLVRHAPCPVLVLRPEHTT